MDQQEKKFLLIPKLGINIPKVFLDSTPQELRICI